MDVFGTAMHAVAMRSPIAYPLVFAAGAVTSVGPCAAPRYVALAALVSSSRAPRRIVIAFVAGLAGMYVAVGLAAGTIGLLWSASGPVYLALACVLGIAGVVTILRGDAAHSHERAEGLLDAGGRAHASFGGTFLLGASGALVVSPCCTPVVAGIAGLTTLSGRVADGAALLAAFACGHALPLLATGALGSRLAFALRRVAASHAPATVAGSLMIALAVFYGTLA